MGAPAGSVLLGNKEFIKKARRIRKVFGGGMRQAGFIAAAGVYALNNNIERLKDDHCRAKEIGNVLKSVSYVKDVLPVETNIIILNLNDNLKPENFVQQLAKHNIKVTGFGKQAIRFVTHLDFDDVMLEKVEKVLKGM